MKKTACCKVPIKLFSFIGAFAADAAAVLVSAAASHPTLLLANQLTDLRRKGQRCLRLRLVDRTGHHVWNGQAGRVDVGGSASLAVVVCGTGRVKVV